MINMIKYPIYNKLIDSINEKKSGFFSVTPEYKHKIRIFLEDLTPEQSEQLIIILIHHYLTELKNEDNMFDNIGKKKNVKLPYGIEISSSGNGCSFELDKSSPKLLLILGEYCGI